MKHIRYILLFFPILFHEFFFLPKIPNNLNSQKSLRHFSIYSSIAG